jgi:hypothetical protein
MAGPIPCAPFADVEEAASARRLHCANVSNCLTVADRAKWPAFRCGSGCYVAPTPEQRTQEHEGLTMLRYAIERQQ